MNEFLIELDRLKEQPLVLTYDYPAARLQADDETLQFTGQVTGTVTVRRVGQDVLAHGELHGTAQGPCARCLTPTEAAVTAAVKEMWARREIDRRAPVAENEEEPDLTHPLVGDQIELSEIFRELMLAEAPDRFLCGEGCKGLCAQCGANLNEGPCGCGPRAGPGEEQTLPDWKRKLKGLRLDE
jgi:uncharacterized protein